LATALGLLPGLAIFERDEKRERQTLESLACWAGQFTPTISLVPPDTLLLEIGGCLRLFGGAEAIIAAALAGCAEQSYSARWAAAPTPLGLAGWRGPVRAAFIRTWLACSRPWPSCLVLSRAGRRRLKIGWNPSA
jgi:hypothetical protein